MSPLVLLLLSHTSQHTDTQQTAAAGPLSSASAVLCGLWLLCALAYTSYECACGMRTRDL